LETKLNRSPLTLDGKEVDPSPEVRLEIACRTGKRQMAEVEAEEEAIML
jgi:hypothetical protein